MQNYNAYYKRTTNRTNKITLHYTMFPFLIPTVRTYMASQYRDLYYIHNIYIHMYIQCIGLKYQHPPPLPSVHVKRQFLLDEIVTKLLQATTDPGKYEITLTITGAGGFGKTSTITSLCHQTVVKEQFTDGFIFIELGPQATDPNIKLKAIYNLLTGKQCDINVVEQKILRITNDYYRNLLVIIDDVWYVEDAEPLVKAFSNCKTILTTRMNDIEHYIPSKTSVVVGPMKQDEAISLLTSGIIDSRQLSQEDVSLLHEIAQDVYLWPLLLSLIRGQLSHHLKHHHLSYHNAIRNVQAKLYHKGLTAFDKNNIETVKKFRKAAVKACIELSLELLTKSFSDRIKVLILFIGMGTSLQTAMLSDLWQISKQEAEDTVETLWAYGLVQFSDYDITLSPSNITQHCVEVHAVISQYINENMESDEVEYLDRFYVHGVGFITSGLRLSFQQSCGVEDLFSLPAMDLLKYKLSEIENIIFPFLFKRINAKSFSYPHKLKAYLQVAEHFLNKPCNRHLLLIFGKKISSLIVDCIQMVKDTSKFCRKLNQIAQRNLYEGNYDKFVQAIEETFLEDLPVWPVTQKAIVIVKEFIKYCDGFVFQGMMMLYEKLQFFTRDHNLITLFTLPGIKLYIKVHKKITNSLLNGSPSINETYNYIINDEINEEIDILEAIHIIKLQDVAPNWVHEQALQQPHKLSFTLSYSPT